MDGTKSEGTNGHIERMADRDTDEQNDGWADVFANRRNKERGNGHTDEGRADDLADGSNKGDLNGPRDGQNEGQADVFADGRTK